MEPNQTLNLLLFLFAAILLFLWLRSRAYSRKAIMKARAIENQAEEDKRKLEEKYSWIIEPEHEISKLKEEAKTIKSEIEDLRKSYSEKRTVFDRLKSQVAIFDEKIAFAELGVYEPHFDFGDSEAFKDKIKEVRERQKQMISHKLAAICPTDWTVDGSKSKGKTMINRQMRLTMRAFNNECEAAISNARWNNVIAMEKRILNAAKQIDAANTSMHLVISESYIRLKLEELYLTHEYREKKKIEKDERAERARLEREEKKLLAEAAAAEKEEARYQSLLDKARKEVGADEQRIADLEAQLFAAHEKAERAKSMAEKTKSGYVYIISNVGSFGDDVVKIGLTRRLEPDDRVKELGDASVPFVFDTHAMIYSEEAPALEASLHREFDDKRVNAANYRKEFFRVSIEEVEEAVARLAPEAEFYRDREAQEWHETLAKRKKILSDKEQVLELPDHI